MQQNTPKAGAPAMKTTANFKHTGLQITDPSLYDARVHHASSRPTTPARAYEAATGNKITIGSDPELNSAAHELTHTIQQGGSRPPR